MKKKGQPYLEIINLSKELKEYKNLCKGKSDNFKCYTDWKDDISDKFSGLDTSDKKENFKHYLINQKRICKNAYEIFVPIMTLCLAPFVNNCMRDVYDSIFNNTEMSKLIGNVFGFAIIVVIISLYYFSLNNDNSNDYCFYCDLIEILEEIEKEPNKKETDEVYIE